MRRIYQFCLLLSAIFFLSSCLTTEYKEYRFKLNENGSGSGTVKFINIVSQEDEEKDVSFEDFGELISDYIEGSTFEDENPNFTVSDKRLFEENGVLCGEVTFTFDDINSIGFFLSSDCECAPILYYLGSLSETFNETNGTYLGEEEDFPLISWNSEAREFYFKTTVQDDLSDCHSLLPLYNTWKESQ
ncbi:MAG: hypothetical protein JW861_10465 [Bacteroidales bacterium]|nr:hypothetical protein [Bacteroidales bacterium]